MCVVPSFAVNDGNTDELQPDYLNPFLPVENLVATFASSDSDTDNFAYSYLNMFGMTQMSNPYNESGSTFMSWVRDGTILANSTLSYMRAMTPQSSSGYILQQGFSLGTNTDNLGLLSNYSFANSQHNVSLDEVGVGLQFGAFTFEKSLFEEPNVSSSLFKVDVDYMTLYGNNDVELDGLFVKVIHSIEYYDEYTRQYVTDTFYTYHPVVYFGNLESRVTVDLAPVLYSYRDVFGGDYAQIRSYNMFITSRFCYQWPEGYVTALGFEELYEMEARLRRFTVQSQGFLGNTPTSPYISSDLVITQPVYLDDDFNLVEFALNVIESFLELPIFATPNGILVTLGSCLGVVFVVVLGIAVLKIFFGG